MPKRPAKPEDGASVPTALDERLSESLIELGFDFLVTTCSVEQQVGARARDSHVPQLTVQSVALALEIAAGAAMAGRSPVVALPSDSLGTALDTLRAFDFVERLPLLMLVFGSSSRSRSRGTGAQRSALSRELLAAHNVTCFSASGASRPSRMRDALVALRQGKGQGALLIGEGGKG
jgi:sulfopyruvate decarboxylase TPP-binding subunit